MDENEIEEEINSLEKKQNIDTTDVVEETNKPVAEKPREPSEPVVIATYRIPEKKRNYHNRIFFLLFCISIIVFGTVSFISFPLLIKNIKEKNVYKDLYESRYVFLSTSENTQKNAIKLYTKAAHNGDSIAQEILGMYYYNGEGVKKDIKAAIEWLTKSAEQGNSRSQYMLADLYFSGKEVTKNHTFAAKWYKEAAKQGNDFAQYYLANMYMNGDGVAIDRVAALTWLIKSAEQGNAYAQNDLGDIYLEGPFYARSYKKALSWYLSSAEQGYAPAIYSLGHMYFYGLGINADCSQAITFYKEAAKKNYMKAQAKLGLLNYNEQVYIEAFKYFSLAAEQGDAISQLYLGRMYENGYGIIQDYSRASYWYTKAAEQGNKEAKESLKQYNND